MTAPDTAARLDRIEAHMAIADLIHEYARLARRYEPEKLPALFAPDGTFEIREGHPDKPGYRVRERVEGREALNSFFAPAKGGLHPIPLIHNLTVAVDGDSATASSVMEAQLYGAEGKFLGEYRDTLVRVDGRWLFTSRTFTIYIASSTI